MAAVYTELLVYQYSDFSQNLTISNVATGYGQNLSGYTFSSQIRKSPYSANISANITCTAIDSGNGVLRLTMNSNTTANLSPARYVFDLITQNSTNYKTRTHEGIVTVLAGVTR